MMKQRYCYIVTDPDGKEIGWSFDLNRKRCIKFFAENYSALNPKKWKYWYRRKYRVKKIPLIEEKPELKTMVVYYDKSKSLESAIKNMAILYSKEAYIIGEDWKWKG